MLVSTVHGMDMYSYIMLKNKPEFIDYTSGRTKIKLNCIRFFDSYGIPMHIFIQNLNDPVAHIHKLNVIVHCLNIKVSMSSQKHILHTRRGSFGVVPGLAF